MIYDRNGFKNRKKYLRFLGLVSHEFFHTWNVKRIRPKELGPFDYYNEVYTKLLWIAEGVTSYYDNLFLARSNVATIEEYFEIICNDLKRYENTPGKDMMTVEDSSFDAWIKLYRPNENSINTSISYYLKGGLIIMALDLTIRDITNGQKSLDHVYQKLWIKYKDDKKGIDDLLFKGYCEDIAGQKLNHIWNYLNTTTPLNINDYLKPFGVELNTGYSSVEKEGMAFFGLIIRKNTTEIANTLANTSSHEEGLNAGDEIIAINDNRVNVENLDEIMSNCPTDKSSNFLISRDGIVKKISISVNKPPFDKYTIKKVKSPTDRQKKLFYGWLKNEFDD